jgi:formate dehydrogenase major subunit
MWAETDGTFTNYDQRVQRFKRAFDAPGDAKPGWEVALDLLARLGKPMNAATAGDVFALMAAETKGYADLTHRSLGSSGRAVGDPGKTPATA